jgi:hypothetical protein
MTSTLIHPGRTAHPRLMIVAAFVMAALVLFVLALSAWSSGGGTDVGPALQPIVRAELPCKLHHPC